jgi:hypothetical protein
VILDSGRSSPNEDGVRIDGNKSVAVGNIVDNVLSREGIRINGNDAIAANNIFNKSAEHGIKVNNGVRARIDSNKVFNPGQDDSTATGITVEGARCDVGGNYVEGSPSQGIKIESPYTKVVDNRVAGSGNDNIRVESDSNSIGLNWLENATGRGVLLADASSNLVATNYFYNNDTAIQAANPNNDCKDNRLEKNQFVVNGTKYLLGNSTRTVRNGLGLNGGDPSTGGDWNGNGFEGLLVRDTSNNDTYLYNAGVWSQIAST